MPLTLKLRRSNYVNERYTFDREQTARVLDEEAEVGCWYRMSKFSLSAAVARISTEKHSRVCVSGCKLVSESHCEAPGIYNYRAGVLFQQDCEVNKPAGEERRRRERKGERREKDRREEPRGNEEKSSARTFSRYSACYKVDGTLEGKGERRRADRDGKDERAESVRRRDEEGGATRAGNKLWARGVWRTCCARPRYALAGEWMREERGSSSAWTLNKHYLLARFPPKLLRKFRDEISAREPRIPLSGIDTRLRISWDLFLSLFSKHEVSIALWQSSVHFDILIHDFVVLLSIYLSLSRARREKLDKTSSREGFSSTDSRALIKRGSRDSIRWYASRYL